MNIVVLAPHPDDEAIGCGGSILLHAAAGDRVTVVFLTSGELGLDHLPIADAWEIREREAKVATEILGVARIEFLRLPDWYVGDAVAKGGELLRPIIRDEKPDIIYLPHPEEWHPDHRAALPVLRAALSSWESAIPELRGYEVWTPLPDYNEVADITAVMRQKLCAVRTYESQLASFAYDRAVRGLNQYRGALAGKCRYAEVFTQIEDGVQP